MDRGSNSIRCAAESLKFFEETVKRSHPVVIRVYDAADNVIQTHEQMGDFKES